VDRFGEGRPVSRPRLLRTMQRKGPCLSTKEMPATYRFGEGREAVHERDQDRLQVHALREREREGE